MNARKARWAFAMGALVVLPMCPRPNIISVHNAGTQTTHPLTLQLRETFSRSFTVEPGETEHVLVFRWHSTESDVRVLQDGDSFAGSCGYLQWKPRWVRITLDPQSRAITGCIAR
jgi:hypothetical protein